MACLRTWPQAIVPVSIFIYPAPHGACRTSPLFDPSCVDFPVTLNPTLDGVELFNSKVVAFKW